MTMTVRAQSRCVLRTTECWDKLRDLSTRATVRLPIGAGARRALAWAVTATAVLALAVPSSYPWRGRLWFAFYQPPPERALEFLDETVAWLQSNRSWAPDCRILGDSATQFAVAAQLGLRPDGLRKVPRTYARDTEDVKRLLFLVGHYEACGVLVGIPEKLPLTPPPSQHIATSGHWDPALANFPWLSAPSFAYAAEELTKHGWTRTPVPPFYLLYEPP